MILKIIGKAVSLTLIIMPFIIILGTMAEFSINAIGFLNGLMWMGCFIYAIVTDKE
jgi:hypothetical protein